MMPAKFKLILILLFNFFLSGSISYSQSTKEEQHTMVALRMIGHEILLDSDDSTSRVFPIEKENDRYKIRFASAFAFNPGDLAATIDRLVTKTKIASSYIVEVIKCESEEVVYSYEKGDSVNPDLMPCGPRFQPRACYTVYLTILKRYNLNVGSLYHSAPVQGSSTKKEKTTTTTTTTKSSSPENEQVSKSVNSKAGYSMIAWPIGSAFAFIGLAVYFRKKKQVLPAEVYSDNSETVLLGDTRFDQKNMVLVFKNETTELSSKESDLLSLLYAHMNKTIEREQILKIVWGDEGDYIGRTLDVFVSKLRKKLESDERVKIVNIRGIGYKLIVN